MRVDNVGNERKAPSLLPGPEQSREFSGEVLVDHSPHQVAFGFGPGAVNDAGEHDDDGEPAQPLTAQPVEGARLGFLIGVGIRAGMAQPLVGVHIRGRPQRQERGGVDDPLHTRMFSGFAASSASPPH